MMFWKAMGALIVIGVIGIGLLALAIYVLNWVMKKMDEG